MIELTAEQIAAGWVAIPDDCMEMPAALKGLESHAWMLMWWDGEPEVARGRPEGFTWDYQPGAIIRKIAYRILSQSPAAQALKELAASTGASLIGFTQPEKAAPPPDANAAMIARDGAAQTFEQRVDAMVGTGCIFGTPRVERCNLLTIADIPATGFSVWGA